jgi:hypothetical protein
MFWFSFDCFVLQAESGGASWMGVAWNGVIVLFVLYFVVGVIEGSLFFFPNKTEKKMLTKNKGLARTRQEAEKEKNI